MFNNRYAGISLQQMHIFVNAAKYENFRQTAENIHMTQATISRNISLLEEQTGLILFIRFNQKVRLTSAGKKLAAEFEQILNSFQIAIDNAMRLQRCEVTKLTIGDYNTTSMDSYLLPVLKAFEKQYPEAEISIVRRHPDSIISSMNEEKYDLVFAMTVAQKTFDNDDLKVETIYELEPKVILSKNHNRFEDEDLNYKDLLECEIVLLKSPKYDGYNDKARLLLNEYGFSNQHIHYAEDPYDIAMELQRGNRIAILDELFSPDGGHNFRYVDLPDCGIKFGLQIVYSRNNDNPYLLKFIKLAKEITEECMAHNI